MIDFPTELAQQHTHLMQKENHHRELNDELKDENTMLHKKLQGKPCISAKSLARVMETNALMQTWKQIPTHNFVAIPGYQKDTCKYTKVSFTVFENMHWYRQAMLFLNKHPGCLFQILGQAVGYLFKQCSYLIFYIMDKYL